MTSPALDITIDTHDLERTLQNLETALSPIGLSLFLTGTVLPWVKERAENRFLNEGDEVVGKWAPLAPSTQEFRANGPWGVGPDHPINKRSGDLEDYITNADSGIVTAADAALLIYPNNPPTGPLKEKVQTAQGGKSKPKTPARPVLGLGAADMAFTMQALKVFIEAAA